MKINAACLLVLFVIFNLAAAANSEDRKIPYADAVTFLGIENASKALKKAVCAVQISG